MSHVGYNCLIWINVIHINNVNFKTFVHDCPLTHHNYDCIIVYYLIILVIVKELKFGVFVGNILVITLWQNNKIYFMYVYEMSYNYMLKKSNIKVMHFAVGKR